MGLPDGRAVRKQMEMNAKVRKKKRESKRRKDAKPDAIKRADKNYSNEDLAKEEKQTQPVEKRDSIKTVYSNRGDENYLILVFIEAHPPGKDSLLIKYPETGDEVSDYEKQRIKSYLDENKSRLNDKLVIKEYIEYSQPERRGNNSVKTKLIQFLEVLGINPKSIQFKE